MLDYVAVSAASAPPPRGLPFAPPAARASGGGTYVPPALRGEGGADVLDEDAQPAFAAAASGDLGSFAASGSGDEDGPPLDVLEAQMGGEVASRDHAAPAAKRRASREADEDAVEGGAALPEVDALTARLPVEVRETLEELFRARFVSVKKLPKKVFKSASVERRSDAAA